MDTSLLRKVSLVRIQYGSPKPVISSRGNYITLINGIKFLDLKKKRSNYIFNLFLFFYLIVGLYLSVNTGITTDELEDQYKWSLSLNAIKDFFGHDNNGFQNLYNYIWKYHGMGFHYFSHIYLLIAGLFVEFGKLDLQEYR